MTCSSLQTRVATPGTEESDPVLRRAERLLADDPGPSIDDLLALSPGCDRRVAAATAVMDRFRRTGSGEAFDCLVALVGSGLSNRARARVRRLGSQCDPEEILQDTLVNIFRYPDRFAPTRANAFAAWSSAIIDNAIRRKLRTRRSGPKVALSPIEILSQQPDSRLREPDSAAVAQEEAHSTAVSFGILLAVYLHAVETLSDRERYVLQMVEVRRLRYSEVAEVLGIRAEAVKMVVFRARRRVFARIGQLLAGPVADSIAAA